LGNSPKSPFFKGGLCKPRLFTDKFLIVEEIVFSMMGSLLSGLP
jgi:hypothetical protein